MLRGHMFPYDLLQMYRSKFKQMSRNPFSFTLSFNQCNKYICYIDYLFLRKTDPVMQLKKQFYYIIIMSFSYKYLTI